MRTSMKKKQGFRGFLERGQQNFETQKMENKIRKFITNKKKCGILPRNILKQGMIIYGRNKLLGKSDLLFFFIF